jgi:CheY-like chemotaxis protein
MKPLSILVVDDDEPTRRVLQLWLKSQGHRVFGARGGAEALDQIGAHPVDIVITDILMPEGDGIELIKTLKNTRPKLHVLAISGGGPHVTSASCLQRAHRVGAEALLLKPFQPDQLAAAIGHVLRVGARQLHHHDPITRQKSGTAGSLVRSRDPS